MATTLTAEAISAIRKAEVAARKGRALSYAAGRALAPAGPRDRFPFQQEATAMSTPLQEIRVRFGPVADDGYRVRLTDAAGEALGVDVDFTPFLDDSDYENLRWYLEEFMDLPDGGAVVRAEAIEAQLRHWGRRLHAALFGAPENRAALDRWLASPRELAVRLKDQVGLGQAAQNLGIVCQEEGEAARERGDESAARRHFEAARSFVEEALRIRQALDNKPAGADSWSQLARIHLLLGDLPAAERHAHAAREIYESLGLKEAWKTYNTLAEIAEAQGAAPAAAEWAGKRDALLAETEPRAPGG